MAPTPPSELVSTEQPEHPEFSTVVLTLDRETALDRICEELKGIALNESAEGTKIRTTRGDLLAIVEDERSGDGSILHYRTAPASETTTLKARKIWRTLDAFEE